MKHLLLLPFLALTACDYSIKTNKKAEAAKLMQTSRDWSASAGTDSLEKTLSYWSDSAVILPPGQAPIRGKEGIRQMVTGMAKIPDFHISWEPKSAVIADNGDLGYLLEENTITVNDSTGKPQTTTAKAVTIWQKQADGSWKNVVDTWNAGPAK